MKTDGHGEGERDRAGGAPAEPDGAADDPADRGGRRPGRGEADGREHAGAEAYPEPGHAGEHRRERIPGVPGRRKRGGLPPGRRPEGRAERDQGLRDQLRQGAAAHHQTEETQQNRGQVYHR